VTEDVQTNLPKLVKGKGSVLPVRTLSLALQKSKVCLRMQWAALAKIKLQKMTPWV